MLIIYLLGLFSAQNVTSTTLKRSRASPPSRPTPVLVQGDIAVPVEHNGTGKELSAFLSKPSALWPKGVVSFWIETFEWDDGVIETVFTVDQKKNITEAHRRIMEAVPCIRFK